MSVDLSATGTGVVDPLLQVVAVSIQQLQAMAARI
jgi:hypothetical protein